jgi:hypothetical protein
MRYAISQAREELILVAHWNGRTGRFLDLSFSDSIELLLIAKMLRRTGCE